MNVYVAPVNINYIKTQFPKEAPALAEQFRTELQKDIAKVLEEKNRQTGGKSTGNWFPAPRKAASFWTWPW